MEAGVVKAVWELEKRGYADSTIKGYVRKLKTLSRLADLNRLESVRSLIARKTRSNAFKGAFVGAYEHYASMNALSLHKHERSHQSGASSASRLAKCVTLLEAE